MSERNKEVLEQAKDLVTMLRGTSAGTFVSIQIHSQEGKVMNAEAAQRSFEFVQGLFDKLEETLGKLETDGF
jgi:hypothetical protein